MKLIAKEGCPVDVLLVLEARVSYVTGMEYLLQAELSHILVTYLYSSVGDSDFML